MYAESEREHVMAKDRAGRPRPGHRSVERDRARARPAVRHARVRPRRRRATRGPDGRRGGAPARAGRDVEAVRVDLATQAGVEELHARIGAGGRPLAAAAINAGIAAGGAFAGGTDLEDELALIDLNVRGTVHLAKLVAGDMVARGEGRMLFTSSIAANMPGAFHAVYNGSKSFVQVLRARPAQRAPRHGGQRDRADARAERDRALREGGDGRHAGRGGSEGRSPRCGRRRVRRADGRARTGHRQLGADATRGGQRAALPDRVKAELHRRMAEPGSAER